MSSPEGSPCLGVVVFVLRRDEDSHRYLYVRRSGGRFSGQWWPVTGTREAEEAPHLTALRELCEETGLVPQRLQATPLRAPHLAEEGFLRVYLAYVGEADEVVLNHEHDAFRWLDAAEVKALTPERNHVQIDLIEALISSSEEHEMPWHRRAARLLAESGESE